MYYVSFDESEQEGKKMFLEDNDDSSNEDQVNDQMEIWLFNNKDSNNEDIDVNEEDNKRRFYINQQNKTENNQFSTSINTNPKINVKSCQDMSIKINETPEESTVKNNIPTKNKKKEISRKIFDISKVNKKVGRMLKKLKRKFKASHNKNSEDNIIRKIKGRVQEIFLNYINYKYSKYMETKGISKKIKLLQRINPEESRKISKADNMKWFSTKLKDLFSSNLSQKCSLYNSDYNKCRIEEIYKNNEAIDVINILEKDMIEMYNLYRYNVKIEGFETLEDDLKNIRKKMEEENEEEEEIEEYLLNYKNTAMRLYEIFDEKKGRKKKKSKKSSL